MLSSDLCKVRPTTEPVPGALLGSPAADIFRHLVRMNDGRGHLALKAAVSGALASIDAAHAAEQAARWARDLANEIQPAAEPSRLSAFAFRLPIYVVASLLGVPHAELDQTALWMRDFVRCLAPGSGSAQLELGKVASGHLLELFRSLLAGPHTGHGDAFAARFVCAAKRAEREDVDVIVANGIGLLSQAYEATAGLIGNTLVALGSLPGLLDQVRADARLLRQTVHEVLRYDSPIQNTRRYLARDEIVAGQAMREGDAVLVVLAAANRDPSANPDPDRFDIFRSDRRDFAFGAGAHASPVKCSPVPLRALASSS